MEHIRCPKCGRPLEDEGTNSKVWCPKCGEVQLPDDSAEITISDGELSGPGLSQMEEDEFDIRAENFSDAGYDEESVIKINHYDSSNTSILQSKIPAATVEENLDFEWKAEGKQVGHPMIPQAAKSSPPQALYSQPQTASPVMAHKHSKPRSAQVSKAKMRATQRTAKRGIKSPWHYYALFYGLPAIIVLILVSMTLYRLFLYRFIAPPKQVIVAVGPKEIWKQAERFSCEARVYHQEAMILRDRGRQQQYRQKLNKAKALYDKAIMMGLKSWDEQLQLLMKQKHISKEQAERYANTRYTGYQESMQDWQQQLRVIKQAIAELPAQKP